jgi:hypothetical protein
MNKFLKELMTLATELNKADGFNALLVINEMENLYNKHVDELKNLDKPNVIVSHTKPPLGLTPKMFHDERVKIKRFNDVCGAIVRYYDAGLQINIEWINEYNELVKCVGDRFE